MTTNNQQQPLDMERISTVLSSCKHFHHAHFVPDCTSTQDEAWKTMKLGQSGCIVFTDYQNAGRGRQGRQWHSPSGKNLLFSAVLSLQNRESTAAALALVCAVAISETLQQDYQLQAGIKWPNDVLIGGRKLAGILVETQVIDENRVFGIGLGVNVNLLREDFPESLRDRVTSLQIETGVPQDRGTLAASLLLALDRGCSMVESGLWKDIEAHWQRFSCLLHQHVKLQFEGQEYEGTVVHLDPLEGIALQLQGGYVKIFPAGQTHVLQAAGCK